MKRWVQKLVEQLGFDRTPESGRKKKLELSDDRATLLYIIDIYSKHLVEIENHPVRKVRDAFDDLARELVDPQSKADPEKLLFRFRQFFSSYRVDEYTYVRKTFEDFKAILWDFVEQLADDSRFEQVADKEVKSNLKELKEAVESESIDVLRSKSREFIDSYIEYTSKRDERRVKRMSSIKKNLDTVKKKLVEADKSMRTDHLTGAFNRRSFDEHVKQQVGMHELSGTQVTLCILDIDFFKKINDTYGHDIGDFVLKECVRLLTEFYSLETDFVARIGGEEFAVILQDHEVQNAVDRAGEIFDKIRKEVFVHASTEIRFTVSMGIAQLTKGENSDQWIKRADQALYDSKHGGRNRWTVAAAPGQIKKVA
jgi:diguanylate cyclase (GGDEF)-like protein